MGRWHEAARRTLAWPSIRRSLLIAALVGTVVNAINQGPEMFAGHWPVLWKIALTYLMPFLVVSYGSYAAFRNSPWRSLSSHCGLRLERATNAELGSGALVIVQFDAAVVALEDQASDRREPG